MIRFIAALALGILLSVSAFAQSSGITAGAIRWDAWYANTSSSLLAQQTLGASQYQSRAPVHCSAVSAVQITCPATQATMDAEIVAAVSGGLKYWAFVQYLGSSSLSSGWTLYQSSATKNNINWCWITNLGLMGSTGSYTAKNAAFVAQFGQSNYQKVTIASVVRPVLYILWSDTDLANSWGGSLSNVAAMITDLRAQTVAAGLGTPYIVIDRGVPSSAATDMTGVGADAISAYNSVVTPVLNGTFAQYDTGTRAFWTTMAGSAAHTVPIAMNGFFQTSRIAHPESFAFTLKPYIGINNVWAISTNAELVTHLAAAVTYINANPSVVDSKLLLIYAWNECDEGGCFMPTIGDPTGSKLAAIKSTIN